ncbi:MAG: hypothetical protein K0Q85_816 [Caproiciproducens sp.]|nr:hypothetical protein [Caproiciproducens sp.]
MGNSKNHITNTKAVPVKKNSRNIMIGFSALIILVAGFFIVKGITAPKTEAAQRGVTQQGADIQITKSEITETAKFIPYNAGGVNMELIAVKAPDGTVRTAFNTCQVCYDSGRGYYKQEGDELICQNCGNRFKIGQVEKQKNGCNPVPVLDGDKTDNGTTITIPQSFLEQNKTLFGNWKKG